MNVTRSNHMKTEHIDRTFNAMGARVKFGALRNHWTWPVRGNVSSERNAFTVDIARDDQGEFFDVRLADKAKVDFSILDVHRHDRHLLLMAKTPAGDSKNQTLQKFLCGHDERFWFVAAVPSAGVSTVTAAKEALKPALVRSAEAHNQVKQKDRHRRKNTAFVRQGEWFFVPAPDLVVDERVILNREPLRRGRSKPHMAEFLYRRGGVLVHVCRQFPNGLTDSQYGRLLSQKPEWKKAAWTTMVRNPEAYAKGRISHPDHKTVVLSGWHRVVMNAEVVSKNVAFLD